MSAKRVFGLNAGKVILSSSLRGLVLGVVADAVLLLTGEEPDLVLLVLAPIVFTFASASVLTRLRPVEVSAEGVCGSGLWKAKQLIPFEELDWERSARAGWVARLAGWHILYSRSGQSVIVERAGIANRDFRDLMAILGMEAGSRITRGST